jgi:hypothetical protein
MRPDWLLSQSLFFKGSGEIILAVITWGKRSGFHEMINVAPGCRLIPVGSCPRLGGGLSFRLCYSLGIVFDPCHKDVLEQSCPFWNPRWLQERMAQTKTDTKWRQRCQAFLLLLGNLWAQGKSQSFQQEWFKYLLQSLMSNAFIKAFNRASIFLYSKNIMIVFKISQFYFF